MSRIVAVRAAFELELQHVAILPRYWFEIPVGGLDARPTVRGANVTHPGAEGQTHMPKIRHDFPLTLHGLVGEIPDEPYLELMDDLNDVFEKGAEVELTLHPDATGVNGRVPSGFIATTLVEVIRIAGPPAIGDQGRVIDIECVGITAPLGWTVEAEPS